MRLESYIKIAILLLIGLQANAQSKVFFETGVDLLALTEDKKVLNLNVGYHQNLKYGFGLSVALAIQRNQTFSTYNTKNWLINEDLYPYPQNWLYIFEKGELKNNGLKFGITYTINKLHLEIGGGINKFTFADVKTKLQVQENSAPQNEYVLDIEYSRELSSDLFYSLHSKVCYLWTLDQITVGPYLDYVYNFNDDSMQIKSVTGDLSPFTEASEVNDFNQNSKTYVPNARGLLFGGVQVGYSF